MVQQTLKRTGERSGRRSPNWPREIVDGRELTLKQWMRLLWSPPFDKAVVTYQFPTDALRGEFLETISSRRERDVRKVLSEFLISTGTLGADEFNARWRLATQGKGGVRVDSEYERRLMLHHAGVEGVSPWEGITWVLDLLPRHPREALAALSAYFLAHIQHLPDGRFTGLGDALAVIRARYIGTPASNKGKLGFLLELTPREFEELVAALYTEMGYRTELTAEREDGGRDVLANKAFRAVVRICGLNASDTIILFQCRWRGAYLRLYRAKRQIRAC